jgi:hypothetical protein
MLITSKGFSMDLPLSFCCTGALSITPIGFSMPLPLSFYFLGTETWGNISSSTTSLRDDDLVKGFLILILAVGEGEEKCNFLPLLAVDLVDEGTTSNLGAGGG